MIGRGERRWLLVTSALALLASREAGADSENNAASAEVLFQAGEELMEKGRPEEACPKFEESFRLDPAGSTALRLGDCKAATGKAAAAWARYQTALQFARRRGRVDKEQEALGKIQQIEGRLAWVTIDVSMSVRGFKGLRVRLDGEELGVGSWGIALPVDPGEHLLASEAEDWLEKEQRFSLQEGERRTEMVRDLSPRPSPSVSGVPALVTPVRREVGSPVARRVALGLGAVGLLATAVGGYLAWDATKLSMEAQRSCFPTCVQGGGEALYARSLRSERWATAALVGGGAMLGAGLVVYLLTPRASVANSGAWGAGVRGSW